MNDLEKINAACTKKSFLKLPVDIDTTRLLNEYNQIPESAWGGSYWDVHCSIDMVLLRGGNKGSDEDFHTGNVVNTPLLDNMPYIASLISSDGPFGGAAYAFIFRTKPDGITRVHYDDHEAWKKTVRIHVPIITNDGAFLLSEKRAKHLSVGEVWTFDNQTLHSVVNGDSTRVHMIFDVNPNAKFAELMTNATFDPGEVDLDRWALTLGPEHGGNRIPPLMFATGEPLSAFDKISLNLNPDGFATRVERVSKKGKLLRTPIKKGDVIVAVNNVEESVLSRTALDHIQLKHEPGETVLLDILRDNRKMTVQVQLKPEHYFSLSARLSHLFEYFDYRAGQKINSGY